MLGTSHTRLSAPHALSPAGRLGPFRRKRLAVTALLIALAAGPGELGTLTRELMTDAYVQVAAFVAATLLLFYGLEDLFDFDLGETLRNAKRFQVPLAALLGAMPGCGGAVMVVAAYSSRNVSFGAVVATLTATMGDAAFLLIANRPEVAALVLPLSFLVGILTGYAVDWLDTTDYREGVTTQCEHAPLVGATSRSHLLYGAIAVPGLVLGILQLANVDLNTSFGQWPLIVGLLGTTLGLLIWSTSAVDATANPRDSAVTRMAEETSFITVWVIVAYLAYDYLDTFAGLDLETAFGAVAPALPLIGALVGLIPGCGPQVLVTTLYINNVVPYSVLIGNAIANDGDALFPAIAINPRAAIIATAYSAVPAIMVAYGFHIFAPGLFP
jgi:hypothetical protein